MSEKILSEKIVLKDAPAKDAAGRTLVAEAALEKAVEEGAPDKSVVIVEVPGIVVVADDGDGAGMARALATLAAMVPG
jgi:hypothetical protein